MTIMITLNQIRASSPCLRGWKKLLRAHEHIGMDTEFPLSSVLDSNGLDDTLWCFLALPEYMDIPRRFALWCARQVQHLMTDERSRHALDVLESYLDGNATREELDTAYAAASFNAGYVRAPYAVRAAADAAGGARAAIYGDGCDAANAARAAVYSGAGNMRERQIERLKEMIK